ncbi:MAG: helicase C-terminal domain-containing protein [Candidatus Thorarchaeota archaeon]|jgi:Rad3-related DNA helicase
MTILSDNPKDYNLPFDAWWPNQKAATEACVNLQRGQILVSEQPTGTGKSGNPALVSRFRPGTTAFVMTRDLQTQYQQSFGDFAIVWGQEHYQCIHPKQIETYRKIYKDDPNRADCPFKKVKDCPYYDECPYEQAKALALVARAKVLNLHYAYYTDWWKHDERNWDLFCDEAHRLPEMLSDLISVSVKDRTRQRWGLPQFIAIPESSSGRPKTYRLICGWLEECMASLAPHIESNKKRHALRAKRFSLSLKELHRTLQSTDPNTWHIQSKVKDGFNARPVIPGNYAHRVIAKQARSLVFMSATIGNPDVLMRELGLANRDYTFLTYPHIFPQSNRPVIWLRNSPRIRFKTTEKEYERQAAIISGLIKMHKGERGLIHTASWHHTKSLATMLGANGVADRIFVPEGERNEQIEKFKNSDEGTVVISPSWQEGLNFPDDEVRFAILAKVPFLSRADPVIRMRMAAEGGNEWYRWKAALKIVQAAGRGVRHKDDWCVTYIADGCYPQVAPFTPKWFEVDTL